ncbi:MULTISPECIES: hypothetical protein [unclassified Gluconobacter]|uniref:hypothetical protein n=1 Tax=unclassified Gluconobacter TaxID=2644261 RepID=UPI001923313A|nr:MULTISPECIES: hypothetical protein [unclassified Gluconobacter]
MNTRRSRGAPASTFRDAVVPLPAASPIIPTNGLHSHAVINILAIDEQRSIADRFIDHHNTMNSPAFRIHRRQDGQSLRFIMRQQDRSVFYKFTQSCRRKDLGRGLLSG